MINALGRARPPRSPGRYHRAMSSRGFAALVVAAVLTLAGCTGGGPSADLPPAASLLSKSADAMRAAKTAAIAIVVDPAITVIPLRNATGRLTADGQADGTAVIALFGGPPLEYAFVATGGLLYLKGPTGGYTKLPLAATSGIFDPTAILDPSGGAVALLAAVEAPTTQARETVDGVDSYRVAVTVKQEQLQVLVPGVTGSVPGLIWLDAATSRLVKVELQLPDGPSGTKGGPVTVRFSEYDAPVTITAPS